MSEATVELDVSEWDGFLDKVAANVARAQAIMALSAQTYAFQDIIQHFSDESGPEGAWKGWADSTRAIYNAKGWGGNKILQATGKLRQSLLPGQGRVEDEGSDAIRLFSNVEYSAIHNYGGPFMAWGKPAMMPKRTFMWLSEDVQDKMVNMIAQLMLEGT